MRKALSLLMAGGVVLAVFLISAGSESAEARSQYRTAIGKKYPDLVKKHGKNGKLNCNVCHPTSKKKERNNYGLALSKILKKNEKDKKKIEEALEKVAKEDSATKGKTFGDLIKEGKLPGTDKVAN